METIKTPSWKRLYFETHPSEILPATPPAIVPAPETASGRNFWLYFSIGAGLIITAALIFYEQKQNMKRAANASS